MMRLSAGIASVLVVAAFTVAHADSDFTTVTIAGSDDSGLPTAITYEIFESTLEAASDDITVIEGRAFSMADGEMVPITISAQFAGLKAEIEDEFLVGGPDGEDRVFRAFTYVHEEPDLLLTRVVVFGAAANGSPVTISATDDPAWWLPAAIYLGAQVAFCAVTYASPWLRECPEGYDIGVSGSLTGITCSFSCK